MDILSIAAGTAGGSISVGAVAWYVFRAGVDKFIRGQEAAEADIRSLRDKELVRVETRLGKIEERCVADQAKIRLDAVSCTLARMEDKLISIGEDASASRATIESYRGWIHDVREEMRAHVQDGNLHGGKR
ncbi:MAG: hypothetical protein A2Y38_14495 [Spirochaetes bacterium GWB1_59_5]|nr:MAG: hypothetical protein A2Y38_14495 [Spirochaetes bacterium GWB1_59_5]